MKLYTRAVNMISQNTIWFYMIPIILYDSIWFLWYYMILYDSYDTIWFLGYYMIHMILYDSHDTI